MAKQKYSEMGVTELKRKLDRSEAVMIVDVRNPDEFAGENGHIPGAHNVPFAHMPAALNQIAEAKDAVIAVNCGSAGRSERAAALMVDAGFNHISVIQGGLAAWREAGFDVA